MKRKVIQIADSTQLISLPRKWALKFGIQKGQELDVTEEGSRIIVGADKSSKSEKVSIDVSDLDSLAISKYVEEVYRLGYDEVEIAGRLNIGDKKFVSVVQDVVDNLIGMEIVSHKDSKCTIKDLSSSAVEDLDPMVRRVFIMIEENSRDFYEGVKKSDKNLLIGLKDKHRTTTKFVNYCLRLLNKIGYSDSKRTSAMYNTLVSTYSLSELMYENSLEAGKMKIGKESVSLLSDVNDSISKWCNLYYKFDYSSMSHLSKTKAEISKKFKRFARDLPLEEAHLLNNMSSSLNLLRDLGFAKIC